MALKAQRFDEAQSAYEDILKGGYTVEAWCGLGACKMFQLASGQTLEEVVYCYEKAIAVEGADKSFVDKHLISHVNVVCSQYAAYAIEAIKQAIQAEKDAARAAVIGLVAAGVGGMSSGLNTKIIAGVAAGVSAGVAIGKFAEIKDSKEIAQYCVNMLESTHASVENFLLENSKLQEAVDLRENIESLGQQVFQALPEKIREVVERKQRVAASSSGLLVNYNLPLCEKYDLLEDSIIYGALIQRRQSEVGLFKKDKYKKLFMSAILKHYDVKFMDWGNLGLELKKSGIADDQNLLNHYSHISVE